MDVLGFIESHLCFETTVAPFKRSVFLPYLSLLSWNKFWYCFLSFSTSFAALCEHLGNEDSSLSCTSFRNLTLLLESSLNDFWNSDTLANVYERLIGL